MARKNYFKPNAMGYRAIMNGPPALEACETAAGHVAASASSQSGTDYYIDSQVGLNRIHTRVSTQGIKDYMREQHYHALAIACEAEGGTAIRGRTRRRLDSFHTKKWRGWKPSNRPRW